MAEDCNLPRDSGISITGIVLERLTDCRTLQTKLALVRSALFAANTAAQIVEELAGRQPYTGNVKNTLGDMQGILDNEISALDAAIKHDEQVEEDDRNAVQAERARRTGYVPDAQDRTMGWGAAA